MRQPHAFQGYLPAVCGILCAVDRFHIGNGLFDLFQQISWTTGIASNYYWGCDDDGNGGILDFATIQQVPNCGVMDVCLGGCQITDAPIAEWQTYWDGSDWATADYMVSWPNDGSGWFDETGTDGVILDNILGIACDIGTALERDVWFLEDLPATNTAVVELWDVNQYPYPSGWLIPWCGPVTPVYAGVSFGEDFFYDTIDITIDSLGYIYVLELNANGDPVIWAWDGTGSLVATTGPMGIDKVSGTPIAIDCSLPTDPDEVHLVHTDGVTIFAM